MSRAKQYIWNFIIWIDQGFNTLIGGSPDHTVSGRCGFYAAAGKTQYKVAATIINTIFFDKDHCWNSIEWDVMGRAYPLMTVNLKERTVILNELEL